MTASMTLTTSRRTLLAQAGGLGLAALPWPVAAARTEKEPGPRRPLTFTAYRNGSRFGFHTIDFSTEGKRIIVDIEIAFDVKLAFIPLYRYRHKNREVWEEGKLISLKTETDDNGEAQAVRVERAGGRLLVEGSGGNLDLPGDTLTTSYWNEAAVTKGEWLDTQAGKIARSVVTKRKPETVLAEGQRVEATPYDLEGDITCTLWYADGRWVKLKFIGEDGSVIDYALEAPEERARVQNG